MADQLDRAAIVALDKRRVWHPYTPMRQYIDATEPLVIERAEGARIFDVDGKAYLDGNASWWVALLGHRHPRLMAALRAQSDAMCHVALAGITHEPAAALAEELCGVAPPGLSRVFYSDNGSTAVEVALKLALQLWHDRGEQRDTFVALDGAFHGDTLGVTGLGGVATFRRAFETCGVRCRHVPVPPRDDREPAYAAAVAALLAAVGEIGDRLAGIVLEPLVQGAAGMRMYSPQYLRDVRRICDERGVPLIVDEVFTGFGRTGSMFATEQAAIPIDIMCLAKGLSGGVLPFAATLVTEPLFEAFMGERERAFYYGHTYCGHPLGAAIAREVLAIYREEEIVARAQPKIARLQQLAADLGAVAGVRSPRQLGMIAACDLTPGGGYGGQLGWRVYQEALSRGAYLRPLGDTVYLTPSLTITTAELDELCDITLESVRRAL